MKKFIAFITRLLVFVSAVLMISCDDVSTSPTTSKVKISPDSVTLEYGDSQVFTASGGYEYTWSLEDDSLGTLSTRSGPKTTYTSLYNPDDSTVKTQVLTVDSTVGGGSATNSTPGEWTDTAYITQMAEAEPDYGSPVISPSYVTLTLSASTVVTFTVSGGKPPYTWSVANDSLGNMTSTSGDTNVYNAEAGQAGVNTILVTDSNGAGATADINQTL